MQGFLIRVTAHHGDPQPVGRLPVRAGVSRDVPINNGCVVNWLDGNPTLKGDVQIVDLNHGSKRSDYDVDQLLGDFEDEYGCKVNYEEPDPSLTEVIIWEFDVFEPNWADQGEAQDVIDDLTERLKDWVFGYPTGR